MPEQTTPHAGNSPVQYPADGPEGVLTPSARMRRQMIKGGTVTVLAVGAACLGWTKVLLPEGSRAVAPPDSPGETPAGNAASDPKKNLGAVSKFAPGAPVLATIGGADGGGSYLVDNLGDGQFRVLSASCTHKGCTVSWSPKDSQFICPCHDGRFARDGKNVSGPPRTPLPVVNARVENGELFVA